MAPNRTMDTLLIPVPVSVGRDGTVPGSGQSTWNSMESSAMVSPVPIVSARASCARSHDANAR